MKSRRETPGLRTALERIVQQRIEIAAEPDQPLFREIMKRDRLKRSKSMPERDGSDQGLAEYRCGAELRVGNPARQERRVKFSGQHDFMQNRRFVAEEIGFSFQARFLPELRDQRGEPVQLIDRISDVHTAARASAACSDPLDNALSIAIRFALPRQSAGPVLSAERAGWFVEEFQSQIALEFLYISAQ
jgi:hypothetical protein